MEQNIPYFLVAIIMFLIASMSGIGVGSGGLLVIFLTSYLSYSHVDARTTNLAFFILSSLGALAIHSFKGRIKFKLVLWMSAIGVLGTFIGTAAGRIINDTTIRLIFGIMLLISGGATLFGRKIKNFLHFLKNTEKKASTKL